MEDSKATGAPEGEDRFQRVTELLQEQSRSALDQALEKKVLIVQSLIGDEAFIGRLVDRVIERLDAREAAQHAELDRELNERLQLLRGAKSDEERLAIIEKINEGSAGASKTRWGFASVKVAGSPEPSARS
ncbi:MAG: hypothetical protein L0G82_17375 [Pseudomonas sp.]|nr:hypothetical protein [Pseudomonas sp.]